MSQRRELFIVVMKLSQLIKDCMNTSEAGETANSKVMWLQAKLSFVRFCLRRLTLAEEVKRHWEGEPEQLKKVSTEQLEAHPSKSSVLLSSQPS